MHVHESKLPRELILDSHDFLWRTEVAVEQDPKLQIRRVAEDLLESPGHTA